MKITKTKTLEDWLQNPISRNYRNTSSLDGTILERLKSECFGSRTVEVYGGAYHLAKRCDNPSLQDIATGMISAINNAKFWTPEVTVKDVAQRFCSLFYVDYMLIEVLIGIKF